MIKLLKNNTAKKVFSISCFLLTVATPYALKPELECLRPLLGAWQGSYVAGALKVKTPMVIRFRETKEGDIQVNTQKSIPEFDKNKHTLEVKIIDEWGMQVEIRSKAMEELLQSFLELEEDFSERYEVSSDDALITTGVDGGILWRELKLVTENYEHSFMTKCERKAFFIPEGAEGLGKGKSLFLCDSWSEKFPMQYFLIGKDILEFKVLKKQRSNTTINSYTIDSMIYEAIGSMINPLSYEENRDSRLLGQMINQKKYEVECVLRRPDLKKQVSNAINLFVEQLH